MGRHLTWGHNLDGIAWDVVPRNQMARRIAALDQIPAAVIAEGWTHRSTWSVGWTCLLRSVPLLLPSDRIDSGSDTFLKPIIRRLVRTASAKLFSGHITTGSLGSAALEADGIPPWRIARALYPIDVELFQSRLAEQAATAASLRSRWPAASKVVIAVAKFVERESPLLIIDTFADLRRQMPMVRLLLVGDGPLRSALEKRIADLGLTEHVHLAGYVPYVDLPRYYGASDVFLHVAAFGPWEISVSEAMACGLPVVTTRNIGSAADLIVPGRTGGIAGTAEASELARCLAQVISFAGTTETKSAVTSQVRRIDVNVAAAEIEALIDRLTSLPVTNNGEIH